MGILNTLSPLAVLGQVVGIPYIYSTNKFITFTSSFYSIIFSISHLCIVLYSFVHDNNRMVYFKVQSSLNVRAQIRQISKAVQTYEDHINSILLSIFPIINYKNIILLRRYINYLENNLKSMNQCLDSKYFAKKFNITSITFTIYSLFIILANNFVSGDYNWIYFTYKVCHVLVFPLALAQCAGYILICTEILKAINNQMKNVGPCRIRVILNLYDIMSRNICNMINQIYGFQLLILFLQSFAAIITEVYDHFLLHASISPLDRYVGIFWLILNLIFLVSFILIIDKLQVQVNRFGSLYHQWELNQQYDDTKLTGKVVSTKFFIEIKKVIQLAIQ